MGRKSLKEVRQQEILEGFYQVSKSIGLENASIQKVADYLNINPSLILHYFKTREEIIYELITMILEKYSSIYKLDHEISNYKDLQDLIENMFSRKWNDLFDDGVFYSCYSLTYRDSTIKNAFKTLHDSLRKLLVNALQIARQKNVVEIDNEEETAEIIFAILEGAYYYLGMIDNKKEYNKKLLFFKKQAIEILKVPVSEDRV